MFPCCKHITDRYGIPGTLCVVLLSIIVLESFWESCPFENLLGFIESCKTVRFWDWTKFLFYLLFGFLIIFWQFLKFSVLVLPGLINSLICCMLSLDFMISLIIYFNDSLVFVFYNWNICVRCTGTESEIVWAIYQFVVSLWLQGCGFGLIQSGYGSGSSILAPSGSKLKLNFRRRYFIKFKKKLK
jgi:hypothetical protein